MSERGIYLAQACPECGNWTVNTGLVCKTCTAEVKLVALRAPAADPVGGAGWRKDSALRGALARAKAVILAAAEEGSSTARSACEDDGLDAALSAIREETGR